MLDLLLICCQKPDKVRDKTVVLMGTQGSLNRSGLSLVPRAGRVHNWWSELLGSIELVLPEGKRGVLILTHFHKKFPHQTNVVSGPFCLECTSEAERTVLSCRMQLPLTAQKWVRMISGVLVCHSCCWRKRHIERDGGRQWKEAVKSLLFK